MNEYVPPQFPHFAYAGVAGDTTLTTTYGTLPIGSIVNTELPVWNGTDWEDALVSPAGTQVPLYEVTMADGMVLRVSADYFFYVQSSRMTRFDALKAKAIADAATLWPTWNQFNMQTPPGTSSLYTVVSKVVALNTVGNVYCVQTSTGLTTLNGRTMSAGRIVEAGLWSNT